MKTQRINMITLTVDNLATSRQFYAALGWQEAEGSNDKIVFYKMHEQFFALYTRAALASDIPLPAHSQPPGNITLATNYPSPADVDNAFAIAIKAGAQIIAPPTQAFWGGYSAYYTDPDEHLWEIAHNPFWTLDVKVDAKGDAKGHI